MNDLSAMMTSLRGKIADVALKMEDASQQMHKFSALQKADTQMHIASGFMNSTSSMFGKSVGFFNRTAMEFANDAAMADAVKLYTK